MNISLEWYDYLMAYSPFLLITIGAVGNLSVLVVLCTNHELKQQSSMMTFVFISILDFFSLFTWNLDTYFKAIQGYAYEDTSLVLCRLMVFIQYFSIISSALLLSFISLDRYFTIIAKPGSALARLPFGKARTSLIWSFCITIFAFLLNFHILILNGYLEASNNNNNQTIEASNSTNNIHCGFYETKFSLYRSWNVVKLCMYSIILALIMFVSNTLIILKTIQLGRYLDQKNKQSIKLFQKKRHMTVSLLIITFLFLVMTLPGSIYFAGFKQAYNDYNFIEACLNFLMFSHHGSLFLSLYFSNNYFRAAVHNLIKKINFVK